MKVVDLQIGAVKTNAYVSLPSGGGARAGIVLTFHRDGLDEFTAHQCDDFAAAGFAVIAPNHFHVLPPGKGPDDRRDYLSDEQQGEDCAAAAEWLIKHDPILLGADNAPVVVLPNPDKQLSLPVHQIALVVHGVHLLENLKLDVLAAKGVHEFALTLQPLKIKGGTSSTVSPAAIR